MQNEVSMATFVALNSRHFYVHSRQKNALLSLLQAILSSQETDYLQARLEANLEPQSVAIAIVQGIIDMNVNKPTCL